MRNIIRQQLSLVEPSINHHHAAELNKINDILDELSMIAELIHADLIRGLDNPETGRDGMMTADQVYRVLLIKQMNGFSYEELAFHLEDSRTYHAFCGFGIADEIPSASTLQRDIKKVRAETLEAINLIILEKAASKGIEKGRKVRVDCTVVESNIHNPTDSSLLNDTVRVLARLTRQAVETFQLDINFVDHHRRAKKRALAILNAKCIKKRKKPYKDLVQVTRWTVGYAEAAIQELQFIALVARSVTKEAAANAVEKLHHFISLAEKVLSQTERRVFHGETVSANEKVVSIFEPHTDIIVKDRRNTCYGHKVAITGGASGMFIDLVVEEGNPADSTLAVEMITRQEEIYGQVPRQAVYDGGFASKLNLEKIKKLGVKDVAFSKKRGLKVSDMAKSTWVYKRLRDFRAGIEGMISFLKRCFGLRRCNWRGFESFKSYAWSSVITANLLLMARHLLL